MKTIQKLNHQTHKHVNKNNKLNKRIIQDFKSGTCRLCNAKKDKTFCNLSWLNHLKKCSE